MNGRAIPGAYLFRLYVCDRNELTTSHRGDPPTRLGCLRSRQREVRRRFRLTNVIPERIIFVSRGITLQYIVMPSRTSNRAWSKCLDAGTYCKYSRTSDWQCSLFSKKNRITRIFCTSGWLAVPINPGKLSSTVYCNTQSLRSHFIHKKKNELDNCYFSFTYFNVMEVTT